jgi:hypothetical protein
MKIYQSVQKLLRRKTYIHTHPDRQTGDLISLSFLTVGQWNKINVTRDTYNRNTGKTSVFRSNYLDSVIQRLCLNLLPLRVSWNIYDAMCFLGIRVLRIVLSVLSFVCSSIKRLTHVTCATNQAQQLLFIVPKQLIKVSPLLNYISDSVWSNKVCYKRIPFIWKYRVSIK